jgi:hypothetical protein
MGGRDTAVRLAATTIFVVEDPYRLARGLSGSHACATMAMWSRAALVSPTKRRKFAVESRVILGF